MNALARKPLSLRSFRLGCIKVLGGVWLSSVRAPDLAFLVHTPEGTYGHNG